MAQISEEIATSMAAAERYNDVVHEFLQLQPDQRPDYGVALGYAVDVPLLHEVTQKNAQTDLQQAVGRMLPAAYIASLTNSSNWLVGDEDETPVPLIEHTDAVDAGRIPGRGHNPNAALVRATNDMQDIGQGFVKNAVVVASERGLPATNMLLTLRGPLNMFGGHRYSTLFFDSVYDTARLVSFAYAATYNGMDGDFDVGDSTYHAYYAGPLRECADYLDADDCKTIIAEVLTARGRNANNDSDLAEGLASDLGDMLLAGPKRGGARVNGPIAMFGPKFGGPSTR